MLSSHGWGGVLGLGRQRAFVVVHIRREAAEIGPSGSRESSDEEEANVLALFGTGAKLATAPERFKAVTSAWKKHEGPGFHRRLNNFCVMRMHNGFRHFPF